MTTHQSQALPSLRKLLRATLIAMVLAGTILITTVLPAEFGIDPTGIGKVLGLTALGGVKPETAQQAQSAPIPGAAAPVAAGIVTKSNLPLKSDEMAITLKPNEGAEIKATMRAGEQLVFNWVSEGGPINVDMHGEKPNDGENFTSYWKGTQLGKDQGAFVAPFDGTHGWFWRNRGDKPVTVKVKVSWFYEKFERKK